MQKSYFKLFFSRYKECNWLNSLGRQGCLLKRIKDSKYTFEIVPGKRYNYFIKKLDFPCESESAAVYFESLKDRGISPAIANGSWVYLVSSEGEIKPSSAEYKRNAASYRTVALYLFFFAAVLAVIAGYQIYAAGYLKSVGYVSSIQTINTVNYIKSDTFGVGFVNVLIDVLNFFVKLLNNYFKFWLQTVGMSHAYAVIGGIVPVELVLIICGSFQLDEYFNFRKAQKNAEKAEKRAFDDSPVIVSEKVVEVASVTRKGKNGEQEIQH